MAFLSDELVVEIFSWLPVKSLVRFSCVSKSCKSLISDSQFVKLHLHRSSSRNAADFAHFRLLISHGIDDFGRPYISSSSVTSLLESESPIVAGPSCFPKYSLIGTCNGLICLSKLDYDNVKRKYSYLVRFWNPATRLMSPHSPPLIECDDGVLGFGYDSSSDAYKGVALELLGEKTVSVYNMGEGGNCRRRTIQVSHLPNLVLQGAAVYVRNNTLNWLATLEIMPWYDETESTNSEPYTILSFDMGKEELTQFSLPYCPRCEDEFEDFEPILGVLRDLLCVSQNDIDNQTRNFVVWQMKEFGVHKTWTQLFNIIIDAGDKCIPWPCFATCLSENGDALLLSKSGVSQAVLYIRRENKLEATKIANNIVGCFVENYIESLVSPC